MADPSNVPAHNVDASGEDPRKDELDLRLPWANTGTGPGSEVDLCNTEMPLLLGFYENVIFVPWEEKDLNSIFSDAFDAVNKLESESKGHLEHTLDRIRAYVNRESIFMVEREDGGGAEPSARPASRVGVVRGREEMDAPSPGHSDDPRRLPKYESIRMKIKESRKRKRETASFSTEKQSAVSAKPKGVYFEEPKKGVDRRVIFPLHTALEDVHGTFMMTLNFVLNSMFPPTVNSEYIDIVTTKHSVKVGKSFLNLLEMRGSRPTADKSVVIVNNRIMSAPVVTIEFKGPRLNLGHHAIRLSEYIKKQHPELLAEVYTSNNEDHSTDDNLVVVPGSSGDDPYVDQTMATSKRQHGVGGEPSASKLARTSHQKKMKKPEIEVSAEDMCEYLNFMFCSLDNYYRETRETTFTTLNKMKPVAQTLTQALSTGTGLGLLNTYQTAIGFRLEKFTSYGVIQIRVTPLVKCNQAKGTVPLIIGMCRRGITEARKDPFFRNTVEKMATFILNAVSTRSRTRPVPVQDVEGNDRDNDSDTDNNGPPGGHDSGKNGSSHEGGGRRDRSRGTGGKEGQPDNNETTSHGASKGKTDCKGGNLSLTMSNVSSQTMLLSPEQCGTVEEVLQLFASPERIVAGQGTSGAIIFGSFNDEKVAIKLWTMENEDGRTQLCREVDVYRYVQRNCSSVLGSALPQFYCGMNRTVINAPYGGDIFLVLGFVGNKIKREDGVLLVEQEEFEFVEVNDDDDRKIEEAARKSLDVLHKNGVLHGDIALRNLRVRKEGGKWRAWWIDLGRAIIDKDGSEFFRYEERDECALMFS